MNTQYFYTKSIIRRCVKYFFNNYKIFLALKHERKSDVTKSDLDELSIIPFCEAQARVRQGSARDGP